MSVNEREVVIVGAGISGLAAADQLLNKYQFRNVLVLEATDRIGGRIYPLDYEGGFLQMGAEWIHGRGNPIYRTAKKVGGLLSAKQAAELENRESFYFTQDGCRIDQDLTEEFERFYEKTDEKIEEMSEHAEMLPDSIGALFEKALEEWVEEELDGSERERRRWRALLRFLRKQVEGEHAARDWNQISFRCWSKYVEKPEEVEITVNAIAYKRILVHFQRLISLERILLNSRVSNIDWSSTPIVIRTADQRRFRADHVIVTVPLGHLKRFSNQLFTPTLPPNKLTAIQDMGFNAVDKIHFIYDEPFWPENTAAINLVRASSGELSLSCSNSSESGFTSQDGEERRRGGAVGSVELTYPDLSSIFYSFLVNPWNKNVLTAWIRGDDCILMERASETELMVAVTETLRQFTSNPLLPLPATLIRSHWLTQEEFLGSYSYYSMAADASQSGYEDIATPLIINKMPVIQFAGEATHANMFQTTHGALLTGWREASRLNSAFNNASKLPSSQDGASE